MDEKRDEFRSRVLKAATIRFGNGGAISCVVRNMSSRGAALDVESSLDIPDKFELVIDRDGGRISAIWSGGKQRASALASSLERSDGGCQGRRSSLILGIAEAVKIA